MTTLRELIARPRAIVAPLVLGPLGARLAQQAGFEALYLGGGSVGYDKCVTEANLNVKDMTDLALDIRTACDLPLILDAAGGWGDPMHMRRTMRIAQAAGFAAIEIEDQQLPKRAHHHVGIDHPIPMQAMVDKVREAVASRRSADLLVIARTNLARTSLDEAIVRARAYRDAGADILFVLSMKPDDLREIGRRVPGPLMMMTDVTGVAGIGIGIDELSGLGYRLVVDPITPLLAAHRAMRDSYAAIAAGRPDPLVGGAERAEHDALHRTIDLEALLEIERRTVERG
jgi:2-methylisocitrate lyase-like PEP mutase family enzyme